MIIYQVVTESPDIKSARELCKKLALETGLEFYVLQMGFFGGDHQIKKCVFKSDAVE